MIILDTDHLTILRYAEHPRCAELAKRLAAAREPIVTTVITWEEQLRGWLAEIQRRRSFADQVVAYDRLTKLARFAQDWEILPFDAPAALECARLRKERIRIGTQDLKIAAITLVYSGRLLSRNSRDFSKVPGLNVENWLD